MLTERQIAIFKAIVDEFTRTAEPVGFQDADEPSDFQCSSATIRNEMAALMKPACQRRHIRPAAIPSHKGYRFYEHLMERQLDSEVKYSLEKVFSERHYSMEDVVQKSCDILSQMTNLTSVALGPESKYQLLQHIQLIPISSRSAVAIFITDHGHTENKTFHFDTDVSVKDIKTCCDLLNDKLSGTPIKDVVDKMQEIEPLLAAQVARHEVLFEAFVSAFMKFASDKVYCSGQNNMLYQPEYADINKLREVMKVLEDSSLFRQLANHEGNVAIEISGDNDLIQVDDMAVVSSRFHISDDEEGQLMIVGPTRMQYSKVVALMEYMSQVIEDLYKKEE